MAVKLAPSILSADFLRLGEQLREAEEAGADYIHVDVMDGHFVPNMTLGPEIVAAIHRSTSLPLDVHLMIEAPERWVARFADAGASIVTVHQEACRHLNYVLDSLKERGIRAGVSIIPSTPVAMLEDVAALADLVLVMTVNPGFGGQKLIPAMVDKVQTAARLLSEKGAHAELEVDGGVTPQKAGELVRAGAQVLVAGSSVYNQRASVRSNINALRRAVVESEKG